MSVAAYDFGNSEDRRIAGVWPGVDVGEKDDVFAVSSAAAGAAAS